MLCHSSGPKHAQEKGPGHDISVLLPAIFEIQLASNLLELLNQI